MCNENKNIPRDFKRANALPLFDWAARWRGVFHFYTQILMDYPLLVCIIKQTTYVLKYFCIFCFVRYKTAQNIHLLDLNLLHSVPSIEL